MSFKKRVARESELERLYWEKLAQFNKSRVNHPDSPLTDYERAIFAEIKALSTNLKWPVPEEWPDLPEYSGESED